MKSMNCKILTGGVIIFLIGVFSFPTQSFASYLDYGLLEPGCGPTDENCTVAPPQASLGYTAENTANKNEASGYAGLDSNGDISKATDMSSISAEGTNLATATEIITAISIVSGATGVNGVKIHASIRRQVVVNNDATNALLVYPNTAQQTIGGQTAGAPVSIPANSWSEFIQTNN